MRRLLTELGPQELHTAYCIPPQVPSNGTPFVRAVCSASMTALIVGVRRPGHQPDAIEGRHVEVGVGRHPDRRDSVRPGQSGHKRIQLLVAPMATVIAQQSDRPRHAPKRIDHRPYSALQTRSIHGTVRWRATKPRRHSQVPTTAPLGSRGASIANRFLSAGLRGCRRECLSRCTHLTASRSSCGTSGSADGQSPRRRTGMLLRRSLVVTEAEERMVRTAVGMGGQPPDPDPRYDPEAYAEVTG